MFLLKISRIYASVMLFLFFILITVMQDNVEAVQTQCSPGAKVCDKDVSTTDEFSKHANRHISKEQEKNPMNLPREKFTEEVKTLLSRRQYDILYEKLKNREMEQRKKAIRPTTEKPKNESSSYTNDTTPEEYYKEKFGYECIPGNTIIKSDEGCKVCVCSSDGQQLCLDRKSKLNECTYIKSLKKYLATLDMRNRQLVYKVRRDIIWHRDTGFGNKSFCVNGLSYYSTVNTTKSLLNSTMLDGEDRELCYFCLCTMAGNEYTCLVKNRTFCDYYRWIRKPSVIYDRYKKWHDGYYTPSYTLTLSYRLRRAFDTSMIGFMSDVNTELANSRCVPFISQYTDCTEDNLCNGCRRCTCDAKGSWSCQDISECGTAESNLRRSQDIAEDDYVDYRRFDKASKLLGNEIEEIRKSTLYGDDNIHLASSDVPQDDNNNSERLFSRNKRDSKSMAKTEIANLRKDNNITKPIVAPPGELKSKLKDFKRENIVLKNTTSESGNKLTEYDNTKKSNVLKNNTEKTMTNSQLLNNTSANETLYRRNIRDSNEPDHQNKLDINLSTVNNLVNLKITDTNKENSTNITARKMLKINDKELLYNEGNLSSVPNLKRQNYSVITEANGTVDLSKLEDLTQLLNILNEPTMKQDDINKMLSALGEQYVSGNVNENSDDGNGSVPSSKLGTGENIQKNNILEGISMSLSIDKFHDLLSEAMKLDPLKYHAQLLEDLIESVIPSDVLNRDSSKHVLFEINDKKEEVAKMDLPYLSKAEKKALQNEESLSPKDRLLITLLARESKSSRDSETTKSDSELVSTFENDTSGNELVNLLRKLTNALETKSKSRSFINQFDKNQEITNVKEIIKEFEVKNKHSVYGNVKEILCQLIDGCEINNLKFGISRDRMIDEDNVEELKRHLLRLLADLERIGGTSKKYEFYNRSKVDDVLSGFLKSVDDEKIKEETDYQRTRTRTEIENETANNIKELRHAHSLHHRDRKTSKNNIDNSKATKILAKMLKSLNLIKTETSFSSRRKDTQDYLPGDTQPYDVSKSVMLWERIIHNLNENSDSKKQAETRKMNTLPKTYNQNDITAIINNLENDDLILRKSGKSDFTNDPTFKLSILKAQELEMSKYIKTLKDIRNVMDNIELSPKFLKKIENFLVDVQYDLDLNKHVINTVSKTPILKIVKKTNPDISMFNAFNQFLLNDGAISNKKQQTTTTQKSQSMSKTNTEDIHSLRAILEKYNIRRHGGGFIAPPKEETLIFKKEHIYNQIAKNSLNKLSYNNNKMNPNIYSMKFNNYIEDSSSVPHFSTNIDTGFKSHALDNIEGIIASMCSKIPCQSGRRFMTKLDAGNLLYVPDVRNRVREQSSTGSRTESLIESICSRIPCQPKNSIDIQDTFPRPIPFNRQDLKIPLGIQESPRLLFALQGGDGYTRIQQNRADRISRNQLEDLLRGISYPKIQ